MASRCYHYVSSLVESAMPQRHNKSFQPTSAARLNPTLESTYARSAHRRRQDQYTLLLVTALGVVAAFWQIRAGARAQRTTFVKDLYMQQRTTPRLHPITLDRVLKKYTANSKSEIRYPVFNEYAAREGHCCIKPTILLFNWLIFSVLCNTSSILSPKTSETNIGYR